jgi:DNA-binding response OmpR family regulator
MRILIADDDPWTLDVLALSLGLDGHEILRASDGAEALAQARGVRPDLAIVDWMMPVMDGISLVRSLRADGELSGLPVLMLTAKSMDDDVWAGWQSGVDAYVTKPLDVEVLRREIERICGSAPATSRSGEEVDEKVPGGAAAARLRARWVTAVSEAIAARHLTLLDVAKAGGVAPSALTSVLAGRSWPRPATIVAVSAFLDLDLAVVTPSD